MSRQRSSVRPPGDPFETAPFTPAELRFQLLGAVLNAALTLAGLAWLVAAARAHPPVRPWLAAALLAGMFLADLVSGLLHWAFDTWFDADHKFVRRMVLQVREHHIFPHRIFSISFFHDAGTLSWISLLLTAPAILGAILAAPQGDIGAGGTIAFFLVGTAVTFSPFLVFMLEFHKCGHRAKNPRWVRWLQAGGLILSVEHHVQHHSGNHDYNYCIVNGWADRTLGRLGLFRGLERLVSRATGAQPQRDDHEWLRRYGRRFDREGHRAT